MLNDLNEIEKKAKHVIAKHCPEYKFAWMNKKTVLGYCDYGTRTIALSKFHALKNPLSVTKDTVLHEVAHALTPGCGHGKAWKIVCKALGGTPQACAKIEITGHKWELGCKCRTEKYYRKPTRFVGAFCKKCKMDLELKKVR